MPVITQLMIYPVKSCQGIAVQEATLTPTGFAYDRQWMVVDESGNFLSQRSHPRMAQISTQIKLDHLVLRAPGMLRMDIPLDVLEDDPSVLRKVRVWDDEVDAVDEGDLAATWFSQALSTPCRLVKFYEPNPQVPQQRIADRDWTGEIQAAVQFSDGFPLLVLSEQSVADLNTRLVAQGQPAVPWQRFRPNILVSAEEAYDEDHWQDLRFADDITLRVVKPCTRCEITCTDQTTGQRFTEPLNTLAQYRVSARMHGGITFAQNAVIMSGVGHPLRVGQSFEADVAF